jgi:hypothetical protein
MGLLGLGPWGESERVSVLLSRCTTSTDVVGAGSSTDAVGAGSACPRPGALAAPLQPYLNFLSRTSSDVEPESLADEDSRFVDVGGFRVHYKARVPCIKFEVSNKRSFFVCSKKRRTGSTSFKVSIFCLRFLFAHCTPHTASHTAVRNCVAL